MDVMHHLRRTVLAVVAKILILVLFAVTLYNLVSFSQSTSHAVNQSFSAQAKVNLYGLADDLADPDAFSAFRRSSANIESLTRFYDNLNAADRLELLSMFDQAVPVVDPRGDEAFDYGYGTPMNVQGKYLDAATGEETMNVKSIQLNRKTFDFYNLETTSGPGIDWDRVDYSEETTPILLGANYRGLYKIGDELRGSLYFRSTTFTVAGFLRTGSSVFYQDDINFYLDNYLIVPYPPSISDFPASEQEFYGILAFAMINAGLAADVNMTMDSVVNEIAAASQASGFDQYTLLNVPSYLVQFSLVKKLITDNFGLLVFIQAALALSSLIGVTAINQFIRHRRSPRIRIQWILGRSRRRLARTALVATVAEYTVASALIALVVVNLPNQSPVSAVSVGSLFAAAFAVDAFCQQRMLVGVLINTSRENT